MKVTPEDSDLGRSTPTLKQNLADPIPLIWTKMKRRCSRNVGQDLQIQRERKRKEKLGRSNWRKLEECLKCRRTEN